MTMMLKWRIFIIGFNLTSACQQCIFSKKRRNKAEVEENNDGHSMLIDNDENYDEEKDEMKDNKSKLKRMKGKSDNDNKKQRKTVKSKGTIVKQENG